MGRQIGNVDHIAQIFLKIEHLNIGKYVAEDIGELVAITVLYFILNLQKLLGGCTAAGLLVVRGVHVGTLTVYLAVDVAELFLPVGFYQLIHLHIGAVTHIHVRIYSVAVALGDPETTNIYILFHNYHTFAKYLVVFEYCK
jgi:hypothetical protein